MVVKFQSEPEQFFFVCLCIQFWVILHCESIFSLTAILLTKQRWTFLTEVIKLVITSDHGRFWFIICERRTEIILIVLIECYLAMIQWFNSENVIQSASIRSNDSNHASFTISLWQTQWKTAQASVIHVINKILFVEMTALQDGSFAIYCNIIVIQQSTIKIRQKQYDSSYDHS